MTLDEEERARRLQEIRDRVRAEALKEPIVEVVAIDEPKSVREQPIRSARASVEERKSRRSERAAAAPSEIQSLDEKLAEDSVDEELAVRSRRRDKIESTIQKGGEVPTIRRAAVMLIVAGSFLGLFFGGLLFSANPSDLLGGLEMTADDSPSVAGILQSALDIENGTGGETVGSAEVVLIGYDDDSVIARTFTGNDGRFLFVDVAAQQVIVEVRHAGNITERRIIHPGERVQLSITLKPGTGTNELDLRTDSHLDQSVALGTAISAVTVASSLLGFVAALQAHRGVAYRRTQWLCGLALFSRGGIFIGPGMILAGMALLKIAKNQFQDISELEGDASEIDDDGR